MSPSEIVWLVVVFLFIILVIWSKAERDELFQALATHFFSTCYQNQFPV